MSSLESESAVALAEGASAAPAAPAASRVRPERGDELELSIDALAHGGEGIARLGDGGYVVFVAGAIPGDRVRALVYKRKRNYAHARTLEVLDASPERIPPQADHPGVPWQVLPYERQLEIKHAQVEDALRRIGGLDGFELEPIVPALETWRYRNKLEYSFGNGVPAQAPRRSGAPSASSGDAGAGRGDAEGVLGELQCGFHAPAGWNRVVPIEDCLLASELGNRARRVALRWCREQGLRAWERGLRHTDPAPDGRALLRNLVVREGRRTGPSLQVRLVTTDGTLEEVPALAAALAAELGEHLSGVLWTRSGALAETTAGGETELIWGESELSERLGELDLRISPEAFFQTNTEMAEVLYGIAVEYAALEGWERVYDLYCGTGAIALTLAPRAGELWGIELVEQAVADAIAAASRNQIRSAHFFAGDTRLALPELVARAGRPDVLVVDPPRAGLSQKVVRRIIEASPRRIVYISCNPTTLAPNAAQLVEAGWTLRRVRPVDMFPQTHHVESVALLERA
ncbi:MAG TPA: 23S rRNA (uracil(1939)-C(5))-methyltransferase RlmD [Solirubrobacteraceae bacterium]|jgi:23S rRNA (uracil1939-C5)-methyltransferase|nr:23S rRNA (uracil(1939)-C(5))-methyltransferase RlmD [Solirubrobacteraceae bacterium]